MVLFRTAMVHPALRESNTKPLRRKASPQKCKGVILSALLANCGARYTVMVHLLVHLKRHPPLRCPIVLQWRDWSRNGDRCCVFAAGLVIFGVHELRLDCVRATGVRT